MQTTQVSWLKKLVATTVALAAVIAPVAQAFDFGNTVPNASTQTTVTATTSPSNPWDPSTEGFVAINWTANVPVDVRVSILDNGIVKRWLLGSSTDYAYGFNSIQWDGKINGQYAPAKTYQYHVEVRNATYGNADTYGPIVVAYDTPSGVAPNVYNDIANPVSFYPAKGENSTITYYLNTNAQVSVKIKNGTLTVATLSTLQNQSAGEHSAIWNGAGATSGLNKTYTYEVYATNDYGTDTETGSVTVLYESLPTNVDITNTYADPNPFEPSLEDTDIHFTLNKSATAYLEIFDGSNKVYGSSSKYFSTGGNYFISWDGTVYSGYTLQEKTYTYKLTANGGSGDSDTATGTVAVDLNTPAGTAPNLSNDYAQPSTFNPDDEITRIYFNVDKEADLTLEILDGSTVVYHSDTVGSYRASAAGTYSISWAGVNNSNTKVAEKTYTYRLTASNAYGSDTETGSVTVDYENPAGTAPSVTNDMADPSTFDPNNETTTIKYNLNTSATVTVKIYDGTTTVETLLNATSQSAGSKSVVWDGRNTSNNPYAEKTYTYEVYATNAYGTDTETGPVTIDYDTPSGNAPNITNDQANPSTFDPNDETTAISYYLDKTANVTVKIKNDGATVETLLSSVNQTAGNKSIVWDGRNTSNNPYAEDTYTYEIYAENSYGSDTETGNVVIDYDSVSTGAPQISNDYASPSTFDPDEENTKIYFTLDKTADVTVEILDDDNDVVRTLLDDVSRSSGQNSVTWNGKDKFGDVVDDDTYTYRIKAKNSYGTNTETGTVKVDSDMDNGGTSEDLITDIKVTDAIFDPTENERAEICFEVVNDNTEIRVEVLDGNKVIHTLIDDSEYDEDDKVCVKWNGRDEDNDIQDDDVYQFRVRAEHDNDTQVEYAYTEVDTDGVIIGFPGESEYCGGFVDVPKDSPFCKAIELMGYRGIFNGYADGTFRPYDAINRAEATKVMLLALDETILSDDGSTLGFWDVQRHSWYMPYLRTAQRLGIINGYLDSSFRPNNTINRVELLKIFLEGTDISVPHCNVAPYADTPLNADTRWYMDYACFAKAYGLMSTDSRGYFNPDQPMTRGDVANLFYQFEKRGLFSGMNNTYYNGYYNNYDQTNYYSPGYMQYTTYTPYY